MSVTSSGLTRALSAGAVSGMRTFVMPALVSGAAQGGQDDLSGSRFSRVLGSRALSGILAVTAAGELVADKLPFAPDRTEPPSLAARAISGAVAASVLAAWRHRPAKRAALVGAAAAIVSAHLMVRLRKAAGRRVPDPLVAIAEDCVAVALGYSLVSSAMRDQAASQNG